ncbi:MAG: hypothetical protein ACYDEN_13740 [Acidimicrobiales bacterium]
MAGHRRRELAEAARRAAGYRRQPDVGAVRLVGVGADERQPPAVG